jgi:eukaryotic-like serine/threonine-protein kinase
MPYAPDLAGCALDGRYEVHELIGEGTFGRVYRGYDRRLARNVAIKVIKPWWAEDPDWAESFEREAQMLARVSDPGIVQIFDVGQAEEGLYYVTELVDGESLAGRLKQGGRLAPWEACDIAEQLCRALEHAHSEQIVHRDIKPANVLLSARGRVKVGDLGIARLAEGSTDGGTATIVGTPRYMAPEQASGLPTTPATDIYSAGIVLYEMLAGHPPFNGDSAVEIALRHVQTPPPPLPPGTPSSLVRIVERALEKEPAARYQSAVAMADALARARTGGSERPAPGPAGRTRRGGTGTRTGTGAGTGAGKPKRARAAAGERHTSRTAREPMCFSSHSTEVTPSAR